MTAFSRVLRCRRELSVDADDGLRLLNLANACRLDDQLTEALCWAQWSVRPNSWPDGVVDARAAQGLANVLLDLGRFEAAETWFCKADSAFCMAEVQESQSRSPRAGDLLRAWQLAEGRWLSVSGPSVSKAESSAPPFGRAGGRARQWWLGMSRGSVTPCRLCAGCPSCAGGIQDRWSCWCASPCCV